MTRLNRLLVALICQEGLPFNLAESPHFKAFVHELDPRYVLPSRRSLSDTLIPARYNETVSDMQASLAAADAHAVTTDLWTSSANYSYMGVKVHCLTRDLFLTITVWRCGLLQAVIPLNSSRLR